MSTAAAPKNAPPHVRRKVRPRTVIVAIIVAVVLAWVGQLLYQYWIYEETDDAYIAGHIHQVSPQTDGQVIAVLAHENEAVREGQVLVRLDPLALHIGVERALAGVAQAKAGVAQAAAAAEQARSGLLEAQSRVSQAQAQAAQSRAQAELAKLTLDRDRNMARGNVQAVTPAELDNATAAYDAGQAGVKAADAAVKAMRAAVASARDQVTADAAQQQSAAANLQAAQAAERDAERRASYTNVVAPATGIVGDRHVETGNRVQTGQALFALVEPEVWIEANFKETQLARMRVGQPVEISVDAIPGRTFRGRVDSIAPASGDEFALLPADNATGNFTKVVQRVPVRVAFDAAEIQPFTDRLRPGQSAEVSVLVR